MSIDGVYRATSLPCTSFTETAPNWTWAPVELLGLRAPLIRPQGQSPPRYLSPTAFYPATRGLVCLRNPGQTSPKCPTRRHSLPTWRDYGPTATHRALSGRAVTEALAYSGLACRAPGGRFFRRRFCASNSGIPPARGDGPVRAHYRYPGCYRVSSASSLFGTGLSWVGGEIVAHV